MNMKEGFTASIYQLQDHICQALEEIDGVARFQEDLWERPDGGGGRTRVIADGKIFEKGGVNVSTVHGQLTAALQKQLQVDHNDFFACGISLVIHPYSPMVPTVHANYRFFELYDAQGIPVDQWFGGGSDMTPYYVWPEDVVHFHRTQKRASDQIDPELYPVFKQACDAYFYNHHRQEARGIGGTFFDYLRAGKMGLSMEEWYQYTTNMSHAFLPSYLPIVDRRKEEAFSPEHKQWQELRRGRYVEFNLIHDKGTLFGLRSNGRIESILMSLPPTVRWAYDHHPEPGSREAATLAYLHPRDWASESVRSS